MSEYMPTKLIINFTISVACCHFLKKKLTVKNYYSDRIQENWGYSTTAGYVEFLMNLKNFWHWRNFLSPTQKHDTPAHPHGYLISGDFNINLLNFDKHSLTEDFY